LSVEHVQTKREIASLLDAAGARPRKRFGQNFLIDGNLMRRLVDAAELTPTDLAIEVGAGTGGLTDLLVERAGSVVAVEIDRALHDLLARRFRDRANLTLISGDALANKHRISGALVRCIEGFEDRRGSVRLVANLPYQIATPLVMNLLVDYPQVRRFVFTVQREVGERITASPGGRSYGPLSIVAQLLTSVSQIGRLPPEAFWPRPAIHSVMLRMDVAPMPFSDRDALRRFVKLVRQVFDHRRKTLRSALGYVRDDPAREAACADIDATRRPEVLTTEEWLALFGRLDDPTRGAGR